MSHYKSEVVKSAPHISGVGTGQRISSQFNVRNSSLRFHTGIVNTFNYVKGFNYLNIPNLVTMYYLYFIILAPLHIAFNAD
jgi:hypothetical protein